MSRSLYLDTNIFIKAIETGDVEAELAWSILQAIASNELQGLTSELTIAEVLPKPFAKNEAELVRSYQEVLRSGAGLTVVPVSRSILVKSAEIRSQHPEIRLPDAIHLATALGQNCTVFLSNDRRLRPTNGLHVISLTSTNLDELKTLTD